MRNRSSTGLCARETHRARRTRALSRVPRERGKEGLGKGKVAARFERSGAHLVGQVRLLNVALVLGHRGGCGVGVGVGDVGLGVCVQPVPRESGRPRRNAAVSYSTAARFKQSGVVAEICSIPRRTAVCSPRNRTRCVRKTTLTSVLLCGANGTGHPRRFVSPDRDDLEEPGRLSFLARRGSVPFGELVLRRDLVPELFPPPSAGFLLRRVRVGIRQRCFRTS